MAVIIPLDTDAAVVPLNTDVFDCKEALEVVIITELLARSVLKSLDRSIEERLRGSPLSIVSPRSAFDIRLPSPPVAAALPEGTTSTT
jgi:hypothetical protein